MNTGSSPWAYNLRLLCAAGRAEPNYSMYHICMWCLYFYSFKILLCLTEKPNDYKKLAEYMHTYIYINIYITADIQNNSKKLYSGNFINLLLYATH